MTDDPIVSRVQQVRDRIMARGPAGSPTPPAAILSALVEAAQQQIDAATQQERHVPRDVQAILNKEAVSRLSLAGMPVAQIAAELGLSYGHVSKLRVQTGAARRR